MMSYKYWQSCLTNIEPYYSDVVEPWSYGASMLQYEYVLYLLSAETLLCYVTSLVSWTLIKPKHDACFTWCAKIRISSQLGLYLSSNSRPCCVISQPSPSWSAIWGVLEPCSQSRENIINQGLGWADSFPSYSFLKKNATWLELWTPGGPLPLVDCFPRVN